MYVNELLAGFSSSREYNVQYRLVVYPSHDYVEKATYISVMLSADRIVSFVYSLEPKIQKIVNCT